MSTKADKITLVKVTSRRKENYGMYAADWYVVGVDAAGKEHKGWESDFIIATGPDESPVPPAGYRYLITGEVLRGDDLIAVNEDGLYEWKSCSIAGVTVSRERAGMCCRKVDDTVLNQPAPALPHGYRYIEPDEVLEEGDEYFLKDQGTRWLKIFGTNSKLQASDLAWYRRKVEDDLTKEEDDMLYVLLYEDIDYDDGGIHFQEFDSEDEMHAYANKLLNNNAGEHTNKPDDEGDRYYDVRGLVIKQEYRYEPKEVAVEYKPVKVQ